MKSLGLLLLLAAGLQAQVGRPLSGVVVRPGGRLELLEGFAGAARATVLTDDALDAQLLPQGIVAKTPDAIVFFLRDGRELARIPAPAGGARFASNPSGDTVFVVLRDSGEMWRCHWPEAGGIAATSSIEAPGARNILAIHAHKNGRLRLARQEQDGLRIEEFDPDSAETAMVDFIPGRQGPAAFDPAGSLIFAPPDAERMEPLGDGWMAVWSQDGIRAWDGREASVLIPMADDPLVLTWRQSLSEESLVADSFDMPAAAPGAPSEARFRVRNNSAGPVRVFRLVVEGSAFQLFNDFVVPRDIASGAAAEFWIRFSPPASGAAASGRLHLNDRNVELRGSSTAVTLPEALLNGQWATLSTSAANRIGDGERGIPWSGRLRMRATSGVPEVPVLSGAGFTLEPQADGEYLLRADTAANGMMECQLGVSGRSYRLQVFVFEPAPPKPLLRFQNETWAFGKQEPVEVQFSEAARGSLGGTLAVTFEPEAPGAKDDASIGWLPALSRTVSFSVEQGALKARFGTAENVLLQTGTTAGTITLTATLGGLKDERKLRLAPAPPGLQTAMVQGMDQRVSLRVTGYDPNRDAKRAAFTFYLRNGQVAQPGRIEADVAAAFRSYFAEAATVSGAFVLNVQFPVTGTVSELAGLEMELTNGSGTTTTQRLTIQ